MRQVTAVSIIGLNGYTNVRIPVNAKHCVIVGPNGSGKSTALQIISYALGRQWKKLANLRFSQVSVEFGQDIHTLSRSSCQAIMQGGVGPSRYGTALRRLLDLEMLEAFQTADLSNQNNLKNFATIIALPPNETRAAQRYVKMRQVDKVSQTELTNFQRALDRHAVPKTLYLPTSRRIESDISHFIERIPDYLQREFSASLGNVSGNEYFEEALRFGMDDIQSVINDFERKMRDYSRNRFNKMMSFYLKEMANSQSISIHDLRAFNIDQKRIDGVLSRIEEGLLSQEEKSKISSIIMSIIKPQKGGHPAFHKRWLAHFFVRLLEVDADIAQLERPMRNLVEDLQKYLYPKVCSYDIESYHFSIVDERHAELKLGDLSSGEKQLTALLSILQISSPSLVNVFIDEPELSLSVPWQSEFLPDIVGARSCHQLFAVTHSPFIYENILGQSVVDFLECKVD